MGIRLYRAYTPATRQRSVSDFQEITSPKPEKRLLSKKIVLLEETIEVLLQVDTEVVGIKNFIDKSTFKEIK